MDIIHPTLKWIDHNRGLVIAPILATLLSCWLITCEPTTPGLVNGTPVTATQLEAQATTAEQQIKTEIAQYQANGDILQAKIDAINAKLEASRTDIIAHVEFRRNFVGIAAGVVTNLLTGNPISATSTISSVLSLLMAGGIAGLSYDNIRKGRIITGLKNGNTTS